MEEDDVLKQAEPVPGGPTYCIIEIPDAPGAMAKIRFDEWEDHDGLSLMGRLVTTWGMIKK